MRNKQKLSKMEKCLLQEYEGDMETADRFLSDEECSFPCGSSPGMFLSELFQPYNGLPETDPFSIFAVNQDDLLAARRISALSRKEDGGGCMISLGKRARDVNGRHYAISDTACIQIKVKDPDICCSLLIDTANVFAAEVFADALDKCFMIIEVADSDRICVQLNGFRLLSIDGKRRRGADTGLVVECVRPLRASVHDRIVCGTALDRIKRGLWMDGHTDGCTNKLKRR